MTTSIEQQEQLQSFSNDDIASAKMHIAVKPDPWAALLDHCPAAFCAFAEFPDLAAIEVSFLTYQAEAMGRHAMGVPSAWVYSSGGPLPYVPDVTGDKEIALALWQFGSEIQPVAMTADLDEVLSPDVIRQSLVLTRDFAIVRDLEAIDNIAQSGCYQPEADRIFEGFCGAPSTAHAQLELMTRIMANAELYAEIVSEEAGMKFVVERTIFDQNSSGS